MNKTMTAPAKSGGAHTSPPFTFAPDWKYAPTWAQWVVMNPNGEWWWWSVCPQIIGQRWEQPESLGGAYVMRDGSGAYQRVAREDWSISLMPRPVIGVLLEAAQCARAALHDCPCEARDKLDAAIAKATGAQP